MSEKTKKYLGLSGIVLLLAGAYSVVSFANSYSASIQPSSFRSFSVSAEGKATSIPDVATFSYSVITEGDKNIQATTQKNTKMANDIVEFLKGSKVDSKDIKTTSYVVEPRTQYYSCPTNTDVSRPCPPSQVVGYTIRQSADVKIRDFTTIGDVLNAVVIKGANNVSNLRFATDDPTKDEDMAREDAIKNAMKKAVDIAAAGGFSLGRLISVEESNYSPMSYYDNFGGAKMMSVGGAVAPKIEPGSQETKINITLRYEIK